MTQPRDSRGARTFKARYFTSREVYDLETHRIFARHWLAIGRASETPIAGAIRRWSTADDDFLIVRDDDQRIRCFANVCRHRGTRLCDEDQPSPRRAIQCPYHGWTYGLDGQLAAAPNMTDAAGFVPSEWPLFEQPISVWQGFVMLHRDSPVAPPEESFATLHRRLAPWGLEGLASAAAIEYDVRANWKLIFQNYNECYHCPRVHPQLNRKTSFRSARNDHEQGPVLGGPMQLADEVQSMTEHGRFCGVPFPGLDGELRRQVFYYSVFPNLFISPHPDYVMTHRVDRVAVNHTRITCEFLFHPEAVARDDFDPTPAVAFWDQVNREDWRVCELSQQGIASTAYQPGPYSNLESNLVAFDQHYLAELHG